MSHDIRLDRPVGEQLKELGYRPSSDDWEKLSAAYWAAMRCWRCGSEMGEKDKAAAHNRELNPNPICRGCSTHAADYEECTGCSAAFNVVEIEQGNGLCRECRAKA